MRALAGAALAAAGLYGGYQLVRTGHPWMAFLLAGGVISWGGHLALSGEPAPAGAPARFSGGSVAP